MVAEFLTFLGGSSPYQNMVIYKFKSRELAEPFYECEEGKTLAKLRNEVTVDFVTLVSQYN